MNEELGMNSKATIFWNWFIENKAKYEEVLNSLEGLTQIEIDSWMDIFEKEIHKYNENVWFRMGGKSPYELIITAEGNTDFFDEVLELVNHAPEIENWKVIPFIPPFNVKTFTYKLDKFELTEKDVFFTYQEENGENGYYLEVMFYVTDKKFVNDEDFKSSIIRIAESSVGEYDFATMIGFMDVLSYSEHAINHNGKAFPIYELFDVTQKITQRLISAN